MTPTDGETLLDLALKASGASLEARIAAGLTKDVGILHYEGLPYVWDLVWTIHGKETDFLMEVWQVLPVTRKDGKPRADKAPKLELAASRQFTMKGNK